MGSAPCYGECVVSLVDLAPEEEEQASASPLDWACMCLPQELLDVLWAQIPLSDRALLCKDYYREWRASQLVAAASHTRRANLNLSRVLGRQVLMGHQYTFGVILDMRAKAWNSRRPWRTDIERFPSFLWYLERLCAQAGRDEMRRSVRHAIDRYEGFPGTTPKNGRTHSNRRKPRPPGGLRRHCNWVSIA